MIVFQKALSSDENSEDEYIVAADCCVGCKDKYDLCKKHATDNGLITGLFIVEASLFTLNPKIILGAAIVGTVATVVQAATGHKHCKDEFELCKDQCGKKCD